MVKSRKRAKRRERGGRKRPDRPVILAPEEVEGMRAAGKLAARILDDVAKMIEPGVTTAAIDARVHQLTEEAGAVSAPYGYGGGASRGLPFPAHCCTSINDVVCHGIPSETQALADGDIVNVDVTPILAGFHGDTSRTFCVGEVSPVARRLVEDTREAMWRGIRAVRAGGRVGDIGHAIQSFVEARGYAVVREFTGHGIGRVFHAPPAILHYGKPDTGERLELGMCFTVEPMINVGHWKTEILDDGWTAVTVDGTLSAQFEHTIVVTEDGVEIMTLPENETPPL